MNREQLLSFEKDTRNIENFFNTTEVQDIIYQNKKDRKNIGLFILSMYSFLLILFNFDLLHPFLLTSMLLSVPFIPVMITFYIGSHDRRFIRIHQLQEIFKNKYGISLSTKYIKNKLKNADSNENEFNYDEYFKIYFYNLFEKNIFIEVFSLSNEVMTQHSTEIPEMSILFFSERQQYCSKQQRTEVENCIFKIKHKIRENFNSEQKTIDLLNDLQEQCAKYRLSLLEKYNNGCSRQEIY